MRLLLVAVLLAGLCLPVWSQAVDIFDYQTGRYHSYQVERNGDIFDYGTGRYSSPGLNYSLQRTGPGSWSGYDYGRNAFQDIRISPGGSASVFDYGTARYYNYHVTPAPSLPGSTLPSLTLPSLSLPPLPSLSSPIW